jgi:hypothetical protein
VGWLKDHPTLFSFFHGGFSLMIHNHSSGFGRVINSIAGSIAIATLLALAACAPATSAQSATSTSLPTATPDPCAQQNIQSTLIEFDKLSREFSDSFALAQNTGAAQLAPIISELQRIRREAEDYVIPPCLTKLKEYQLGFMYSSIDAFMMMYSNFANVAMQDLSNPNYKPVIDLVNQRLAQANDYRNKYQIEGARLLGITLPAPTATVIPSETPTPAPSATPKR